MSIVSASHLLLDPERERHGRRERPDRHPERDEAEGGEHDPRAQAARRARRSAMLDPPPASSTPSQRSRRRPSSAGVCRSSPSSGSARPARVRPGAATEHDHQGLDEHEQVKRDQVFTCIEAAARAEGPNSSAAICPAAGCRRAAPVRSR